MIKLNFLSFAPISSSGCFASYTRLFSEYKNEIKIVRIKLNTGIRKCQSSGLPPVCVRMAISTSEPIAIKLKTLAPNTAKYGFCIPLNTIIPQRTTASKGIRRSMKGITSISTRTLNTIIRNPNSVKNPIRTSKARSNILMGSIFC